ncbi:MAG: hypothetical protein N3D84_01205 [Candidatus Woesearchaeota archaeon]|nr:hypothetical protein [Candidatus Woesearchaeota archaeon]
MKKGDLSINIIIIAAIALVIFVVLLLIFSGRMGLFTRSIEKCQGTCVKTAAECPGPYSKIIEGGCDLNGDGKYTTKADDGYCCVSVG